MSEDGTASTRNIVFISKATPGDDEFVLWLSPRLAFELARELRKTYGIPAQKFGDWNPIERLTESKQEIEKYRKELHERVAADQALVGM